MPAPYYVATFNGFLVVENVRDARQRVVYTVADVRSATPFDSFEQADAAAKWGCGRLYPDDLCYFAIFTPAFA